MPKIASKEEMGRLANGLILALMVTAILCIILEGQHARQTWLKRAVEQQKAGK